MVDKSTTDLTAAGALTGTELFPITQAGNSRKLTLAILSAYIAGDSGWLYGSAIPDDGDGADGNFYLRVTTGDVYFKVAGSWTTIAALSVARNFTELLDTPADYSGDARRLVRVNAAEDELEFVDHSYDLSMFIAGEMTDAEIVMALVVTRSFTIPISATGSLAVSEVASTADVSFDMLKNGVSFGTIRFNIDDVGTFTVASATSFVAGDILKITAPATADTTLADVSITLKTQLA